MENTNMFEKAVRSKLRFDSKVGANSLSVEDLWDLPLKSKNGLSLDSVAKTVHQKIKEEQEESFVDERSTENEILNLKMDLVKHVITVKKEEEKAKRDAAENKAMREQYDRLIAQKKNKELEDLSIEELEKRRNSL
jgi:hypothetical protein